MGTEEFSSKTHFVCDLPHEHTAQRCLRGVRPRKSIDVAFSSSEDGSRGPPRLNSRGQWCNRRNSGRDVAHNTESKLCHEHCQYQPGCLQQPTTVGLSSGRPQRTLRIFFGFRFCRSEHDEWPKRPYDSGSPSVVHDEFVLRQCQTLSDQRLATSPSSTSERITTLYELAYSRPPTASEISRASDYLAHFRAVTSQLLWNPNEVDSKAWVSLCRAVLAANEFLYIE